MIRPIMTAECDMCGATKEVITRIGCYNEIEHSLPHGWDMDFDKHMMLCPECLARKSAREGENVVESYS